MWLSAEDFKIVSSLPLISSKDKDAYRVHPNFLLDGKVVSIKGLTGRVVKINQEALREDRYDSIDIAWDNGSASNRVFLLWLMDERPGVKILVNSDKYCANKIYD